MSFGIKFVESLAKSPFGRSFLHGKGFDDQTIDLILANGRMGQPAEVAVPMDLLPILAKLIGQGVLSFQAANTNRDWVWPWFLTRQLDPEDPGFCVRGHNLLYLNMHYRNWTGIGTFAQHDEAVVDPAGLLSPRRGSWSVDVWVRDPEGNWHFPSRAYKEEGKLTQRLVDNLPVVETALDLGSGHRLVMTAFTRLFDEVQLATVRAVVEGPEADKHNVVVSLRPVNPEGVSQVQRVSLKEHHWEVDGEPAIVFAAPPAAQGAGNYNTGDVAVALQRHGVFETGLPTRQHCRSGLVTAFAAFAGQATVHAAMEPVKADEDSLKKLAEEDTGAVLTVVLDAWKKELAGTPTLQGVDGRTQALYDACKSWMLLLYDRDDFSDMDQITPGPLTYHHFWFRDCAYLTAALDRLGRHDLAKRILYTYPHRQKDDGFFESQEGEWDANGQAMWTQFQHYLMTREEKYLREMYPSMARGAKWIAKKRRKGDRDEGGAAKGLLPAGMSAEHLGPNDYYYWDDFWCLRGLLDAAEAAEVLGKSKDADQWRDEAKAFHEDLQASLEKVEERLGEALIPSSPMTRINSGAIGSLCAVYPTEVFAPDDERVQNTVAAIRDTSFFKDAFFQHVTHSGTNIYLSLQVAQCELRAGNPAHLSIWRRILDLASPTQTFPEAVHPITGGGSMGDGHHGWAAAECLHYLHSLFFIEEDQRLTLLKGIDPAWFEEGKELSLGPCPTHFGPITVKAVKEDGDVVVTLDARFHTPPRSIRIHSPSDPGHFVDAEEAGQRTFRLAF